MSTDPDQSLSPADAAPPSSHVLGPRKRIVAREVQSAALTTLQPADLSELAAAIESPAPRLRVRPEPLVLDPTTRLGERHRKHSHNLGYRLTAVVTAVAFVAASAAIALLLSGRLTPARLTTVVAVVLSVLALRLAHGSALARRLRGYAIAATVMAVVAVGLNLAGTAINEMLSEAKTSVPKPQRP